MQKEIYLRICCVVLTTLHYRKKPEVAGRKLQNWSVSCAPEDWGHGAEDYVRIQI